VIDGLLTDEERRELLAWLTSPDHDHTGPPPEDKWERACVDRDGDAATFGLRPEVIQRLREAPPPPAIALQARLAAMYPEWLVAHMPCEVRGGRGANQ
jgi:probable phosphoglycerate mutase